MKKEAILLFLIFFISCRPKIIEYPYIPYPKELILQIKKGNRSIRSLKARGRIYILTKNSKYTANCEILLKKPAYIKGTLTYLYQPLFSFSSDGNHLFIFDLKKNILFIGKATQENLNKLFPINFKIETFLKLITGEPPFLNPNNVEYKYIENEGLILFNLDGLRYIWIDPLNFKTVKFLVLDQDSKISYKGRFDNFKKIKGILFPTYIEIEIPSLYTKIKIKYKNIKLNPSIKNKEFIISPSKGTKIVSLEEKD